MRIAAVCIAVFILQNIFSGLTNYFVLVSSEVFLRPWTIITHAFLHGSFSHLLYNMFALVLFGFILEKIIGHKNFILIYVIAGVASSFACIPLYPASLGASGAIFGIIGALAVLRPKMIVWVFSIPMPMALAAVFWGLGDFIGLFVPSGTANAAHLAGLAVGLVAGFIFRKKFKDSEHVKKHEIKINESHMKTWESKWM